MQLKLKIQNIDECLHQHKLRLSALSICCEDDLSNFPLEEDILGTHMADDA